MNVLFYILLFFIPSIISLKCDSNSYCQTIPQYDYLTNITVSYVKNALSVKIQFLNETIHNELLLNLKNNRPSLYCDGFHRKTEFRGLEYVVNSVKIGIQDKVVTCEANIELDGFDINERISMSLESTDYSYPLFGNFTINQLINPTISGLTKYQKHLLTKLHAILMIIGWLFLVPTGFVFARMGRDIFKEHKIMNMPVWFQVHRSTTFIAVVCICTSMLCILISQNFTWKGTGSDAWYWSQWHTDLGTISTILAILQPINSWFRCVPTDPRRNTFNWVHRVTGITSYLFAVGAIMVAAANYRKTWSEPMLEIVFAGLPTIICLAMMFIFPYLEERQRRKLENVKNTSVESNLLNKEITVEPHILRIPSIFWAIGTFFAISIGLSLIIANGFKNW